ncbi:MAG: hypothetical protein CVV61_01690 [Tenericutes bacterium HGW-Tenericutes-6]|nr:MAG: hypothetical protein CVV61_01690 [Tenericutes bacterium HGW-Tenericutes-6]
MRIFYRIIFAICVALGLYLTIDLTHSNLVSKYIVEQGNIAIKNEDYAFFVSARYYHQTPLVDEEITFENRTFKLFVYNVGNAFIDDDGLRVVEGFQVILYQIEGDYLPLPFFGTATSDTKEVPFMGMQISSLPIYTMISTDNLGTFYSTERFMTNHVLETINTVKIIQSDTLLYEISLGFSEADFKLEPLIKDYYDTYNELPTEDLNMLGYAPRIEINTRSEVIRNAVIYIVIALVVTVLSFTVKKRYMGSKEATEGLRKDIEKLGKKKG